MPRREHTVTHICKTGMSNCVLISPPLKKPFGLVKLGWTGYPMRLLFFGGALSRAVQHFALFNHQQLSLHEQLCQLCVTELSRKQKNFPELLLVLAGNCSLHGSCGQGIFCCRGHHSAKRARLRWSLHVSETPHDPFPAHSPTC